MRHGAVAFHPTLPALAAPAHPSSLLGGRGRRWCHPRPNPISPVPRQRMLISLLAPRQQYAAWPQRPPGSSPLPCTCRQPWSLRVSSRRPHAVTPVCSHPGSLPGCSCSLGDTQLRAARKPSQSPPGTLLSKDVPFLPRPAGSHKHHCSPTLWCLTRPGELSLSPSKP